MPANFTAVNSEVVYGGADLLSVLADTTAPVWNASNVKTFNTNVLTIVGNSFLTPLVESTLGVMFSSNWDKDGVTLLNKDGKNGGSLRNLYHVGRSQDGDSQTALNKVMTTIGLAAAVYNLGTANVANAAAGRLYIYNIKDSSMEWGY